MRYALFNASGRMVRLADSKEEAEDIALSRFDCDWTVVKYPHEHSWEALYDTVETCVGCHAIRNTEPEFCFECGQLIEVPGDHVSGCPNS